MPDLLIRGLDPDDLARLKEQAARHHRSMQTEAKAIIVAGIKPTIEEWLEMADRSRERTAAKHGMLSESSADTIRKLRDERAAHLAGEDS